jgi:hypothetical protein
LSRGRLTARSRFRDGAEWVKIRGEKKNKLRIGGGCRVPTPPGPPAA